MLKRQQIEALQFSGMIRDQFRQFSFNLFGGSKDVPDFQCKAGGIGEHINQTELAGVVEQRLLFMLPVDVQQQRSQLPQSRNSGRLVVDVYPISLVRRYFAADDEL